MATHPCIIAIELGIVVFILKQVGIELPAFVTATLKAISGGTTALSMITIGSMLASADKIGVFTKTTISYSAIRLVLLPAIIWAILRFLPINPLGKNVCILLAAMPAASTTAMLAKKYDRNPGFASQLIFVSTLASLLTLPVWTMILI